MPAAQAALQGALDICASMAAGLRLAARQLVPPLVMPEAADPIHGSAVPALQGSRRPSASH